MQPHINKRQFGFTLIELAIGLAIVGLIVGAGFTTVGAYLDNSRQSHTQNNLEVTKRAMLNYVKVNRYMPCPDTNADGLEDRGTDNVCSSATGTVPYTSLGLSQATASDDWNNVFKYGVNTDVVNSSNIVDPCDSASYFAMTGNEIEYDAASNTCIPTGDTVTAPVFILETPPTAALPSVAHSYEVCLRDSSSCSSTPANSELEVDAIPAVIVAFNENGSVTSLVSCGASESGREQENCDNDLILWRSYFKDGIYDDQMVTISGYEIKAQVLDLLNGVGLTYNPYSGYDVIYLKNVTSANDINISDASDNRYYIGANNDGEDGNLESNAVFKGGDDELYMEGSIATSGDLKMGDGDDELTIETNIDSGGKADTGEGKDTVKIDGIVAGDLITAGGDDTVTIQGDVTGTVSTGDENDVVTIQGDISGSVDAESGFDQLSIYGDISGSVITGPITGNNNKAEDNDIVHYYGSSVTGSIDLGLGDDTLYISQPLSALSVATGTIQGNDGSDKIVFENIASTDDFSILGLGLTKLLFEAQFSGFETFVYSDELTEE